MSEANLNPEQSRAVNYADGPLLILAGAGTGKTRVVTHRIARLLNEGVLPSSILALTFTNKAAREMKERAARIAGPKADQTFISTFHSACARLLRREAHRVGLTPSFSIYDDDDQTSLVRSLAETLGMPNDAAAVREIRGKIDEAKNNAWRVHDVETRATDSDGEAFAELYEAYQHALLSANACDFGDLVAHMVHALQDHEALRQKYAFRFQHLMVDEFQDTNKAQYELITLLTPTSRDVAVVGDDDQAIYGWRGATVENVRRFRDALNCEVVALEQNYRSAPTILEASHAVVERLSTRMEKKLRTTRTDRTPVRVFIGRDDREEADFIAREIQRLRTSQGLRNGDFAVFFRTNAQSRVVEERFRAAGIRHVLRGTVAWFDRKEIKDALSYMRLAVNPVDQVAFRRIANVPKRGIGKTTLLRLLDFTEEAGIRGYATAIHEFLHAGIKVNSKARTGLLELAELLDDIARMAVNGSAEEVLETVFTDIDYEAWLIESDKLNGEERAQNAADLLASARDFSEANEDNSVLAFVEKAALAAPERTDNDASQVQMMSVHASKGLEFPVVFVTGMEDKQFPLVRRTSEPDYDEERRLCYVAFTRARDRLYVSAAMRRRMYGKTLETDPSCFLVELPEAVTEILPESASRELDWRLGRRTEFKATRNRASYDEFDQRPWQERKAVPQAGMVFGEKLVRSTPNAAGLEGKSAVHKTFGTGIIVAAQDVSGKVRLTIDFPGIGRKKIVRQYVQIEGI